MGNLIEMRLFEVSDFNYVFNTFKQHLGADMGDNELNVKIKNRMSNLAQCWICEDMDQRVGFVITNLAGHFAHKKPLLQVDWLYLEDKFCNDACLDHIRNHLAGTVKQHNFESIILTESGVLNPILMELMKKNSIIKMMDTVYSMELN